MCNMKCDNIGCVSTFKDTKCIAPHKSNDPVILPHGTKKEHYHNGWAIIGNVKCHWIRIKPLKV